MNNSINLLKCFPRISCDTKIVVIMSGVCSANDIGGRHRFDYVLRGHSRRQTPTFNTKPILPLYVTTDCDGRRLSYAEPSLL